MKAISIRVLTLLIVLASGGLVVADTSDDEATLNQIVAYRQWARVNPQLVTVTSLDSMAI